MTEAPSNFRVFKANDQKTTDQIPGAAFYFIESTAPDNVEEPDKGVPPLDCLEPIDSAKAVKEIAKTLVPPDELEADANLVVMVHGFNTPRRNVLKFYQAAINALAQDKAAIFNKSRKLVCVGYRWPSEPMFSILSSTIAAAPALPLALVALALFLVPLVIVVLVGLAVWLFKLQPGLSVLLEVVAVAAFGLAVIVVVMILTAALLRAVVYFRDTYRATNYGVPDLVDVIRNIDREAVNIAGGPGKVESRRRIALSFIGHSMGGFVVTNAIRILSDVFDPEAIRAGQSAPSRGAEMDVISDEIGHVFSLKRFVLTSPDIPAETLLSDRGNFLASSLRRFREAYLLSNEGDEVLRQVSRIANYFSFPTMSKRYGYRLGNAEILSSAFGDIRVSQEDLLKSLRVGDSTLADLSNDTTLKGAAAVAKAFTYFDCTDYVDDDPKRGLLTQAKNYKSHDPAARIPFSEQLYLLWLYRLGKIDCHSGYYQGAVTQRLIYRLACLGFDQAVKAEAYGSEANLFTELANHQIRMVKSHKLDPSFYKQRVEHERMSPSAK
jgi:hypothetical protein